MSGGGENEDRVQKGKALRFTGPSSKNENYVAPHIAQLFPFFPLLAKTQLGFAQQKHF